MSGTTPVVSDGMIEVRVLNSWTAPAAGASPVLTDAAWTAGTDITCDLLGDGLNRNTNENAVVIDRLCFAQTGEAPGSYAEEVNLTYAWNPQDANSGTAYGTLTPGSDKALAIRYGVAHGTAGTAGDKVDIIRVTPGQQVRVPVARNEELRVTQKQFIPAGGTYKDVALTSGGSSSSSSSSN